MVGNLLDKEQEASAMPKGFILGPLKTIVWGKNEGHG